MVLAVAACAAPPEPPAAQPVTTTVRAGGVHTGASVSAPAPGSAPTRLAVPDIALDEPLIELGLTDDGAMEVPTDYDDVGWFSGGGRPGGFGPTVLAGHVDSTTGPAAFDRLDELTPDDVVNLITADGGSADYRVTAVGDYTKAEFPTAAVFGATPDDEIRLITCSGDFDAAVGSYEQNFVVFGTRLTPG